MSAYVGSSKNLKDLKGPCVHTVEYRGNSLIRTPPTVGPYDRNMPRALRWSFWGGLFLMSEVPPLKGLVGAGFRGVMPKFAPHKALK